MADWGSSSFDWTAPQPPVGTNTVLRNDTPSTPSTGFDWTKATSILGDLTSGYGSMMGGMNALSSAKFNAGIAMKSGQRDYDRIMKDARYALGAYRASSGATGIIDQSAKYVEAASWADAADDAATARYNKDMEAANLKYEGRVAKAQAYGSAIKSFGGAATTLFGG